MRSVAAPCVTHRWTDAETIVFFGTGLSGLGPPGTWDEGRLGRCGGTGMGWDGGRGGGTGGGTPLR